MPPDMAPLAALENFRGCDPAGRLRGGRRPCWEKAFTRQLKAAPVQAVNTIARAAAQTGFSLGECEDAADVVSIRSDPLNGNLAALDDVPSMDWFSYVDVTGYGGAATNGCNAVAYDPDGEFLMVGTNFDVAGDGRLLIQRFNKNGNPEAASGFFALGFTTSVNAICVCKLYTFVAIANTNTAAGAPKLLVYRNDTMALAASTDLDGWANEAIGLARYMDAAGREFVFVAFSGAARAGTYNGGIGSGVIQAGRWAQQFRSGIAKYQVDTAAYGGSVITKRSYGTQLATSAPYFEAAHGYWRLSEQTEWRPHGGLITDIAAGADGSVYFTKCNQGWGPNNGSTFFEPSGNTEPYATVGKIDANGTLLWMADTDSIRELDDLGFYNDLPFPGDTAPDPSLSAIAVDSDGNCYVGGRQNPATASVFSLDKDGIRRWEANVMDTTRSVREGGAVFDPTTGRVWFAGDRNDQWDGAAGQFAHLWSLDKNTGSIRVAWDINENASALAVAVSGAGKTYYGTDYVS